jgi:hypothetical protein
MNDARLSRLTGVVLILTPLALTGILLLLPWSLGERATRGIPVGDQATLSDGLTGGDRDL